MYHYCVYNVGFDFDGGVYETGKRVKDFECMFLEGIEDDDRACIDVYFPLVVSGKTYKDRKGDLLNKAIEYSNSVGLICMSMGEFAIIQDFFEKNGKRYGLLEEFRENAIC